MSIKWKRNEWKCMGILKSNLIQKLKTPRIWMELFLIVYDYCAVVFAYFFALYLRFDFHFNDIPGEYLKAYQVFIPRYAFFAVFIFALCRLYKSMWRYASMDEFVSVCMATVFTGGVHVLGITWLLRRMPMSYYFVGIAMQFMLVLGARFGYRLLIVLHNLRTKKKVKDKERIMVIGAGSAGMQVLRELTEAKETNAECVCIIDDDKNKWNLYIKGVPIVGGRDKITKSVEEYNVDKILLCMPSAEAGVKRELLEICKDTGCELMILPGIYQFINDEVSVAKMRKVEIEDLLGREPVKIDLESVLSYVQNKTILVTGGGGSIGSELCRQIASHQPKKLIVLDVYENNAYDIQMELRKKYPELDLEVIIASVRDSRKIFQVFETYRPDIVYHAAAHKHVPLMEDSPCEAIKNNAIGTYKTAYAAMTHGCQRFVLISTDKAVNPTNIMGASKRLCEMVIQAFDNKIKQGKASEIPQLFTHEMKKIITEPEIKDALQHAKTEFVAVRFGNVLGSNGSVIPLFKKQIEAGGPVTVTDPDIIRYFMTIPEAVSLVLQAGAYAKGGEIFVLDMGEPVKIDDLARNLIKLSGYKPDQDIKIEYTGLRPGEKLYEEKLMAEEGLKKTENDLIHIGCPIPFDTEEFLRQLSSLMDAAYKNKGDIRKYVQEIVTTYQPKVE